VSPGENESLQIEESGEEQDDTTQQPTQEQLARAYSELYSTKDTSHLSASVYTPVRNPMSMEAVEEETTERKESSGEKDDWVKVNGKPHVHFASPPPAKETPSDPELPGYILVNHSEHKQ